MSICDCYFCVTIIDPDLHNFNDLHTVIAICSIKIALLQL